MVILALASLPSNGFAQPLGSSVVEKERSVVSADLQMIYQKTESAATVADYSAILNFCRNVVGDSTRVKEDRLYARTLMSWAANRRGEARSDQAGNLVREQQFGQAAELDAMANKDRKSTRLNSSHERRSRMPSSA